LLKVTSPKIYKDQLTGAKQVLTEHIKQYGAIPDDWLARLIDTPRLTATGLRERLAVYRQNPDRLNGAQDFKLSEASKLADAALARYSALNGPLSGQEPSHAIH
jgi:hypothetical protein